MFAQQVSVYVVPSIPFTQCTATTQSTYTSTGTHTAYACMHTSFNGGGLVTLWHSFWQVWFPHLRTRPQCFPQECPLASEHFIWDVYHEGKDNHTRLLKMPMILLQHIHTVSLETHSTHLMFSEADPGWKELKGRHISIVTTTAWPPNHTSLHKKWNLLESTTHHLDCSRYGYKWPVSHSNWSGLVWLMPQMQFCSPKHQTANHQQLTHSLAHDWIGALLYVQSHMYRGLAILLHMQLWHALVC